LTELVWVWVPGCGVLAIAAVVGYLQAKTLVRFLAALAFAAALALALGLAFIFLVPGAGRDEGTIDLRSHWVGILPLETAALVYLCSGAGLTLGASASELRRRRARR
jgi:hypothetical protein